MGEGLPSHPEAEAPLPQQATLEMAIAQPPPPEGVFDDTPSLSVDENLETPHLDEKHSGGSKDRDIALAKVELEKKLSMIKAWEESEKSKADNKAQKKLSSITSWENTKKAHTEAKLKKYEELLEKKKAEYAEKLKNKLAMIHKGAEEKRALIEAKRGEELLKAEESAAKYRATGFVPKKFLGCFGG